MKGRYERKRARSLKSAVKIILILVLCLIVTAVIAGVAYYNSILNKLNHIDVPKISYTSPTEEPQVTTESSHSPLDETESSTIETEVHIPSSDDYINFLLVGQAARDGETERFADTMILCTVNTYEKTLTMTSLLRDTLIKMPDYRKHTGGNIKLTTIYHLGSIYGDGIAGSMELMNLTLYENFGIEVDYNFEVDFEAFMRVIDLLGGIDIELTEAEADYLNDQDGWVYQDVESGIAHLDGMTTLCYARMRKAAGDAGSDITRTSRQRKVIATILEKIKSLSVSEIQALVDEVLPLIATSMDNREITQMLITFLPILPDLRIEASGTCPVHYWGDMVDIYSDGMQHSVLKFNKEETKRDMRAITEGESSK